MRSGKRPVSCIPCAKRKVKCDRLRPCYHCRRRPDDRCIYPNVSIQSGSGSEEQTERIRKLEQYVQRLGGDLRQLSGNNLINHGDATLRQHSGQHGLEQSNVERLTGPILEPKAGEEGLSNQANILESSSVITHGDEENYIETPMWYSWKGANVDEVTSSGGPSSRNSRVMTILDPRKLPDEDAHCSELVTAVPRLITIWKAYLKNVHPLVKIFFDWEIEPIIKEAQRDVSMLSKEQRALLFAIQFITTLSLQDEECIRLFGNVKPAILYKLQTNLEDALMLARYASTNNKMTLQAFILYLLAMRDCAEPSALFSLMGIASRIAERMGLHRDGEALGLGVCQSEVNRRVWWQLQILDVSITKITGNLSMTVYAAWDSKLPSNLEDADFSPSLEILPTERKGLTSMSHCLWRYEILRAQRETKGFNPVIQGLGWMLSPEVSLHEKDAKIDMLERIFGEKFLQYCDPLNPLHVYIQLGIHQLLLAARQSARQPALVHAKILTMSRDQREEFLRLCVKTLEYYIMSETTESLRGFRWINDIFFQYTAFVYVILEANYRYKDEDTRELFTLIKRVYDIHPALTSAAHRPEIAAIGRLVLAAWDKFDGYALRQRGTSDSLTSDLLPEWLDKIRRCLGLGQVLSSARMETSAETLPPDLSHDAGWYINDDFDLDNFDWSIWEEPCINSGWYTATNFYQDLNGGALEGYANV